MYAVYLLNLGARFLTPLNFEDICAAQAEANGGTILPSSQSLKADGGLDQGGDEGDDYEFKPFMRQLNEFTFWLCAIRSTYIVLACAQFEFLDLPVFWPLLLLYFVVLFLATMRQQVENMIKYKYIPFNFGKKTYGSITRQQK
ncbi:RER1, putative [Babesia caballi]|uniref:RER1, putative n=1 Tax=Babesia caballi TaxID=5871 RepID=A0AAV4LQS9_BABCB|nr:RER1, putative [Babesia caballi]